MEESHSKRALVLTALCLIERVLATGRAERVGIARKSGSADYVKEQVAATSLTRASNGLVDILTESATAVWVS